MVDDRSAGEGLRVEGYLRDRAAEPQPRAEQDFNR
jgi:hypothetical protein